jgi:isocitrate/isopropylmalate dehydrogenase
MSREIKKVLAMDGDGIGPEILAAVKEIFTAAQVPVSLENPEGFLIGTQAMARGEEALPAKFIEEFKKYGVALKPPYETPPGPASMRSINVGWRVEGDLYANKRPVESIQGLLIPRLHNTDIVCIHESRNTLQQQELVVEGTTMATIFPMKESSYQDLIDRAVVQAQVTGKKTIHLIHKGNIIKPFSLLTRMAKELEKKHPNITWKTMIIDDFAHQMIKKPQQFEIIVAPCIFENIVAAILDASKKTYNGNYENVNIHLTRENTEDLYTNTYVYDEAERNATVRFTLSEKGYNRLIKSAINDAQSRGNKTVTFVYDDVFPAYIKGMEYCRQVAAKYAPEINFQTILVANYISHVIADPSQFREVVTTNMLGDILSDLHAGLVGGLGLVASGNIGEEYAMFEAVHGTAPDIAGKGIANPTGLLRSAVMMLRYLHMEYHADMIEKALLMTLANPENRTGDLGGTLSTKDFTDAVMTNIVRVKSQEEVLEISNQR